MLPPIGIYLHVPFCKSRCDYCDFFSTTFGSGVRRAYIDRLRREISDRSAEAGGRAVATVYLGGGTPSLLSGSDLSAIFQTLRQNFTISPDAEVTLEANPDDVDEDFARRLALSPVNRVSLGVQSFNDAILASIGRRHTSASAASAVGLLHSYGICNLSIDLIYGLPRQSTALWKDDLDRAFALPITHLSAYSLIYEPGTPITRRRDAGFVSPTTEEAEIAMYHALTHACRAHGFEHYEISNFALPSFRSRHNSAYWRGTPYLGFGPGAHSFDGCASRRSNDCSLQRYIAAPADVPHHVELLDATSQFDEMVMTSLRTAEGIDLPLLAQRFGPRAQAALLRSARQYLESGTLRLEHRRLFFTEEGFLLADMVMSDLMQVG